MIGKLEWIWNFSWVSDAATKILCLVYYALFATSAITSPAGRAVVAETKNVVVLLLQDSHLSMHVHVACGFGEYQNVRGRNVCAEEMKFLPCSQNTVVTTNRKKLLVSHSYGTLQRTAIIPRGQPGNRSWPEPLKGFRDVHGGKNEHEAIYYERLGHSLFVICTTKFINLSNLKARAVLPLAHFQGCSTKCDRVHLFRVKNDPFPSVHQDAMVHS